MSRPDYASNPLPLQMMYHWEKHTPDLIAMNQPRGGQWTEITFKQMAQDVRRMATAIKKLDLPEKSHIALMSKNCAHWIMTDLAIWMAGHVSVPLYPNLTAETIRQILDHSEAKLLIVGKLDGWEAMKPGIPADLPCWSLGYGIGSATDEGYPQWNDIMTANEPMAESPTREKSDWATIIYTSGTTGTPKGVVHNFESFYTFGINVTLLPEIDRGRRERLFSYLPLAHIAERAIIEMLFLYMGAEVFFAESLETFPDNLRKARPTLFLAVPRIWSKFQEKILQKLPQKKLDVLLKIPILSGLIKNKIKKGLGLDDCFYAITGAAPIPAALLEWYRSIGLVIYEGYAMTENFCYSHLSRPAANVIGRVGASLPDVEAKIGADDEVLTKSTSLMECYYKEPELTKETLVDGFLRTGDQGHIDDGGFLKITGRVKDLFKTSKGKYVAPSPIEMKLMAHEAIEQACLVGVGLPQPMALIVLSESYRGKGDCSTLLSSIMSEINPRLDQHERMKKLIVCCEEWTVENEILTPTLKVRRSRLEKQFEGALTGWYETGEAIVWEDASR